MNHSAKAVRALHSIASNSRGRSSAIDFTYILKAAFSAGVLDKSDVAKEMGCEDRHVLKTAKTMNTQKAVKLLRNLGLDTN
ncbi:MAG: hypothetical protein KDJ50_07860 [Alphaproteobacteria bacterium]|nr:hypothetical protein [Alphaproteobacteria bacterium]